MNLLHPIESLRDHREKRIDQEVTRQAEVIGSTIVDWVRVDERPGPYALPAGELPKGTYGGDYTGRVGHKVIRMLQRVGLGEVIEYDAEATRLASTEIVRYPDGNWKSEAKRDGMTVVFKRATY